MQPDSLALASQWVITNVPNGEVVWAALMFIVALSILVFFHELGHYGAARSIGARVEAFSIGFGKKLFGWTDKHGTEWKVSLIPLGGYVSIFGFAEDPEKKYTKKELEGAFFTKNVWGRIWVVFAGPLANFILAWVFLAMLFVFTGEHKAIPKVGGVLEGSPAQEAGVLPGDTFISINNEKVISWLHLTQLVQANASSEMNMLIDRAGENILLKIAPRIVETEGGEGKIEKVARIGVSGTQETFLVKYNPIEALGMAAQRTYEYTAMTVSAVGRIFAGSAPKDSVGGPLMIGEKAGEMSQYGWYPFVMFMVYISISLGLMNLLPVPVLDGGHIVFYLVEAIKGSPVNEVVQEWSFRAGFALLMMLMVFVFYNDIMRIATNG